MVFGKTGNTNNVTAKLEYKSTDSCNCCCNVRSEIFHEVYIPENADFSVETINGNIIITGNTAEVRAKSISGYIDLAIEAGRKAEVKMRTITGTMYSNIDLKSGIQSLRHVGGGSVSANLNGGGKRIDLETISGNIFFRKEG